MKQNKNMTIEAVASYGNLYIAHANAKRGKKHYKSIQIFEENLRENLNSLNESLLNGTYRTSGYTLETISDSGKEREIAKVPYPDRVAQWAIMLQWMPSLLRTFHPNSHAAIPEKGIHSALNQTRDYLKKGYSHCLKLDVRKFFPSINRTILKQQIEEDIPEPRLMNTIRQIINDAPGHVGIPIGNYLSQYLANRYLTPFDYWLAQIPNIKFVRYMDDIVIFGDSREELRKLHREIDWYFRRNLYLEIKGNWQIFTIGDRGIDFVGYRVFSNRVFLRKSTFANMRSACFRIGKKKTPITESERSTVAAYLGWIMHCTPKIRLDLFNRYFIPIIQHNNTKINKKDGNCICHD